MMTAKTGAAARNLVAAAEELNQHRQDVTESDLELIAFAEQYLQPLISLRNQELPPLDEDFVSQAIIALDKARLSDKAKAIAGRERFPDDYSFGFTRRPEDV
jgi:hypothetical protein